MLFRALQAAAAGAAAHGLTSDVGPRAKSLIPQTNNREISDEAVMDRFQELLMLDRSRYEDRLDYFEINFDDAVASLRLTARKKAWKEENRCRAN